MAFAAGHDRRWGAGCGADPTDASALYIYKNERGGNQSAAPLGRASISRSTDSRPEARKRPPIRAAAAGGAEGEGTRA